MANFSSNRHATNTVLWHGDVRFKPWQAVDQLANHVQLDQCPDHEVHTASSAVMIYRTQQCTTGYGMSEQLILQQLTLLHRVSNKTGRQPGCRHVGTDGKAPWHDGLKVWLPLLLLTLALCGGCGWSQVPGGSGSGWHSAAASPPAAAAVPAQHEHGMSTAWHSVSTACAWHEHGMRTAWARHGHCMNTAWARHGQIMSTA